MRRVLVAGLLMSPVFLKAQAISPALLGSMHAQLVRPNALVAAAAAQENIHPQLRISTGVIAPKLIKTVAVAGDPRFFEVKNQTVVVDMIVDENGTPSDLKVAKSDDVRLNENVLEAVRQYRFTPGSVSNVKTAIPVKLAVVVQNAR